MLLYPYTVSCSTVAYTGEDPYTDAHVDLHEVLTPQPQRDFTQTSLDAIDITAAT